jgi:hypothetical protein
MRSQYGISRRKQWISIQGFVNSKLLFKVTSLCLFPENEIDNLMVLVTATKGSFSDNAKKHGVIPNKHCRMSRDHPFSPMRRLMVIRRAKNRATFHVSALNACDERGWKGYFFQIQKKNWQFHLRCVMSKWKYKGAIHCRTQKKGE